MKPGVTQEDLSHAWNRFVADEPFSAHLVDSQVLARWERCRDQGFPAQDPELPEVAQHQELVLPAENAHMLSMLNSVIAKSSQAELSAMESFDIAWASVACFDDNMVVYGVAGSEELLKRLDKAGIRFGTNLSESLIGPSPFAECLASGKKTWALGRENTQGALTPYAVCANKSKQASQFFHVDFIQAYFTPIENYDKTVWSIMESLQAKMNFVMPTELLPQLSIRYHAFDSFLERNKIALIITNHKGVIIDVNPYCKPLLGFDYLTCSGQRVDKVIPALADVNLQDHKMVTAFVGEPPKEMRFEFEPSIVDDRFLGTSIYVTSTARDKKKADTVVDTRAHFAFSDFIGKDPGFLRAKETAQLASKTNRNVLICGETGVGKDMLAHAIHKESSRSAGPFVEVNCGGLVDSQAESTLFGNVNDQFAENQGIGTIGKIEQASDGTVYFADVDKLPLRLQPVLAEVLRTGVVRRIGSTTERQANVRVIASAGPDIDRKVQEGSFSKDLFYLLNIMRVNVPALREHASDIPLIARQYLTYANKSFKKDITKISNDAMAALKRYPWPGNVTELRNTIERCVVIEQGSRITTASLPDSVRLNTPSGTEPKAQVSFEDAEMKRVKELMLAYNGNKTKVAAELGITRSTLYRKLQKITDWS